MVSIDGNAAKTIEGTSQELMANPSSKEQAIEWIESGLADVYMNIAFGCAWAVLWHDVTGSAEPIAGTCFFVGTGAQTFGMTAWHVLAPRQDGRVCQLLNTDIDPSKRVISFDENVDVATFEISANEIETVGRYWHSATRWPPKLPEKGKGIFFGGFRGRDRRKLDDGSYECGFAGALTTAEDVSEERIVAQFDRVEEIEQRTLRPVEPGEDWSGASGGPVFAVVAGDRIDSWSLAGVLKLQWGNEESFVFGSISMVGADGKIQT